MNSALDETDLKTLILSVLGNDWHKTAMIIARVDQQCLARKISVSLETIGQHIATMAGAGQIEARGDLAHWRHSEVRLKQA